MSRLFNEYYFAVVEDGKPDYLGLVYGDEPDGCDQQDDQQQEEAA